jgi:uncharacterized protein (TIGR03000 family)
LGLVVAAAPALSQEAKEPAKLRVKLPAADAQLSVDGTVTKTTGAERVFRSPPLPAGQNFKYTLKVTWLEEGKQKSAERVARVVAGQETVVDLREATSESPKVVDLREESPKKGSDAKPDQAKEQKQEQDRTPDVIFVPTPQEVVDKMLELAKVKKTDIVYDLGCGDGRIPVTAAKKYGCKAWGYDIDPQRIKESNENVKNSKVQDLVTIEKKDIFTLDLTKADVVTLYLLPDLNVKLMPQLMKLKPGSRIVSHAFDMKGAKPKEQITVKANNGEHTVYLWIVPWEKEP